MDENVRLHVHWSVTIIAVIIVLGFPLMAFNYWRNDSPVSAVFLLLYSLLGMWLLLLARTKIDINQEEIQVIAPHGLYLMRWKEVVSFEQDKRSATFFAQDKAIGYNLLLAGKGKREFRKYIDHIIDQWQFERGRPAGVSDSDLRKLLKKSKVRGWKLF